MARWLVIGAALIGLGVGAYLVNSPPADPGPSGAALKRIEPTQKPEVDAFPGNRRPPPLKATPTPTATPSPTPTATPPGPEPTPTATVEPDPTVVPAPDGGGEDGVLGGGEDRR